MRRDPGFDRLVLLSKAQANEMPRRVDLRENRNRNHGDARARRRSCGETLVIDGDSGSIEIDTEEIGCLGVEDGETAALSPSVIMSRECWKRSRIG